MNPINILFFALASMIGIEDTRIVSRKVSITINPADKTFEIFQEDLFSIIVLPEDSSAVANELQHILAFHKNDKKKEFGGLTVEKITLSSNGQQLNATLLGSYIDPKVLADAGIYFTDSKAGQFSMINIPEWNIHSSDAVLKEDDWVWTADKPVTIVMEPFENIPGEYLSYRQSILPYWERWLERSANVNNGNL